MKKITLILSLVSFVGFSQQKSTGLLTLSSNTTAMLVLDSPSQTVTLTLSGPNDRWFALQYGSFSGGMESGSNVVFWNNVTLVDANQNGIGSTPTNDAINDWVLISNTNDLPSTGLRTLVYTRAFNTGDATDYVFNYASTDIDLAWAKMSSPTFALSYHGGNNRGLLLNTSLTTLGVEDFSLNATQIYPNPSNGNFTITAKTSLQTINIYTHTGSFVKSIDAKNAQSLEVNIEGLQTGIYLIELLNDTDISWKKISIN